MASFKLDIPVDLSEKTTDKLDLSKKIIHLISGATGILTICIVAPLITIEVRYLGAGKAGPNYTLFVALFTIATPFFLVYFPFMYERYNKFKRLGKFMMKNRTNLIFCGFDSFLWATAGIAITVHANNDANCAYDAELTDTYGSSYTSAWSTQCNLAKTTAAFTWITCILWLVTLCLTGINFWKEKSIIQQRLNEHRLNKQQKFEEQQKQEEEEDESNYRYEVNAGEHEDKSPFIDPHQPQSTLPFVDPNSQYNMQQQSTVAYDPYYGQSQPQPNFTTPGQYANEPHVFSPMPQPEPSYYNNNNNHY
ncbi:uncharacterized protein BX663DRAFT_487879 [Cokeromyces recurvatus]|uniref:uncharacterized protein n=1 Tax=Cokeromyces recurvatus TaxID=90255 RepID=UPI0022208BDC|nr:uncharacterized protein BX663DRAFT_487879 [Cokeromyces recurvatus]KAI7900890.1 hypothetical protein BX663DRAFT_487879 [Cokeromyces recurvatus]